VYFTANPCNPDFMAKASNRLRVPGDKIALTADQDILFLRWLLIDIDARYAHSIGVSSSKEELEKTIIARNKIFKWMRNELWIGQLVIPACSGNGGHLIYRLPDLENNDENVGVLRQALKALAHMFNDDDVDIDTSVFNPARIWKVYGTTARKGDHVPARPHRKSYVEPKFIEDEGGSSPHYNS
jgi:hypothetical protein